MGTTFASTVEGYLRAKGLSLATGATKNLSRGGRGKGVTLELVVPKEPKVETPMKEDKPFAHPRYWAAFILIGEPD